MEKPLNIINIDGVDGIGKTTQIHMMAMNLKKAGVPVLTVFIDDSIDSALDAAKKIDEFLGSNPNGMVLSDGSIARMIVVDSLSGMQKSKIVQKYQSVIHAYEGLHYKYGVTNILMITEDIQFCHDRLVKRGKLLKKPEKGIESFQDQLDIVQGMRLIDAHTISKQLIFEVFDIDEEDSILEVQDMIWDYLKEKFGIKKPISSS